MMLGNPASKMYVVLEAIPPLWSVLPTDQPSAFGDSYGHGAIT